MGDNDEQSSSNGAPEEETDTGSPKTDSSSLVSWLRFKPETPDEYPLVQCLFRLSLFVGVFLIFYAVFHFSSLSTFWVIGWLKVGALLLLILFLATLVLFFYFIMSIIKVIKQSRNYVKLVSISLIILFCFTVIANQSLLLSKFDEQGYDRLLPFDQHYLVLQKDNVGVPLVDIEELHKHFPRYRGQTVDVTGFIHQKFENPHHCCLYHKLENSELWVYLTFHYNTTVYRGNYRILGTVYHDERFDDIPCINVIIIEPV